MKRITQVTIVFCLSLIICFANAKLPAPTPEAKEAAALAAALPGGETPQEAFAKAYAEGCSERLTSDIAKLRAFLDVS